MSKASQTWSLIKALLDEKISSPIAIAVIVFTAGSVASWSYTLPVSVEANSYSQQAESTKTRGRVLNSATGPVYYAASRTVAGSDGTKDRPWDLQTALNKNLPAGSTLYLRSGIYKGVFTSNLAGTVNAPITVRSLPGEYPVIDSYETKPFVGSIDTFSTICNNSGSFALPEGSVIMVDDEAIRVGSFNTSGTRNCSRGVHGTTPGPHGSTSKITTQGSALTIKGSYVWFMGIEITNTLTERYQKTYSGNTVSLKKGGGFDVQAKGVKLINNIVHDVGHPGIAAFDAAEGCDIAPANNLAPCTEIYGNLVWGNGFYDTSRENQAIGSGIYTHNKIGTYKYIRDNFFFRNFTSGINIYTENSLVRGFHIEGNTIFDNNYWDIWYSGDESASPVTMLYNNVFRRLDSNRSGFKLSRGNPLGFSKIIGNYIVGGNGSNEPFAFSVTRPGGITVQNNTIISSKTAVMVSECSGVDLNCQNPTTSILPKPTWQNNSYFGSLARAFARPGDEITFDQWKNIFGFDPAPSTFTSGYPTDNKVFVRKNLYETGRGSITAYKWNASKPAEADLSSILSVGDSYVIKDVQNFDRYQANSSGSLSFVPGTIVASGTYTGGKIIIPLNQTSTAKLLGNINHLSSAPTAPIFGAFIVEKVSGSAIPSPTPGPTATTTAQPLSPEVAITLAPPTQAPTPTPIPTPNPTPTQRPLVLVGPTAQTIKSGETAKFNITSYHADSLFSNPPIPSCILNPRGSAGCSVSPTATTTYVFVAKNSAGEHVNQATVTITASPTPVSTPAPLPIPTATPAPTPTPAEGSEQAGGAEGPDQSGGAPTPVPNPTPSPTTIQAPINPPLVIVGPTAVSIPINSSTSISITSYNTSKLTVNPSIPNCNLAPNTTVICAVSPNTNTTYEFTATGGGGKTATNRATVNVTDGYSNTTPVAISVTKPLAGGYKTGSNLTISWNVTGSWESLNWSRYNNNPYVSLDLYKDGLKVANISQVVAFSNTVTIPLGYGAGSGYQFKISSVGDANLTGKYSGFSPTFTITP